MNNINTMNSVISAQIEANKAGLDWGKIYLNGTELRNARETLISNRINLRRIQYASNVNPAAAVFGESQVGKSYLVDCLLSSEKGVLKVFDGYGKEYGFIESINPLGGGKESTSLVSRFTTKKQWGDNDEYPIKAVLLSPIDVVLTLCDSFFNDVQNHQFPSREQMSEHITKMNERYSNMPVVQEYITEDEIYEMKEYFNLGVFDKGESFRDNLNELSFFETLANIIQAVSVDQWKDVFGYLWNNNPVLTDVFTRLIHTFRNLNFQRDVYIKMDAVLRVEGTILQVDRIYELFGITQKGDERVEVAKVQDMDVWCGNNAVRVRKSEFCALAAELIFKIDEELEQEKTFLKELDILDFPGARSREKLDESLITEDMSCILLLRGKVAYLFNKYSQQYLISNLLFCHHKEKSEVKTLSTLLKGWIEGMVGKTPEKRDEFMRIAEISPLFLVGTKFNLDLVRDSNDDNGTDAEKEQAKNERWEIRFNNLTKLIGENDKNKWFSEWTTGQSFKNLYLLRSYEYSCRSGIFAGYLAEEEDKLKLNYTEDRKLVGEKEITDRYKNFLPALQQSFAKHSFVKKHFMNPEKSWSEAVMCNHDGSDWIIENLTKSSTKALQSRVLQFNDKIHGCFASLCKVLRSFYHDDNSDKELAVALKSAGEIDMMLDVLFGKDKYFFSEFIEALLIREDQIHDQILDTIKAERVLTETDLQQLFAIRDRAKVDPELSYEENQRRVRDAYHYATNKELDERLKEINLTLDEIINPPVVKNLGRILVDAVEEYWFNTFMNLERFQEFVDRGLTEKAIKTLLVNMRVLYKDKLLVTDKITERIRPYIAAPEKLDDMADMIADICSEMINKFINTFGTAYFYDEIWQNLKDAVEHNHFNIKIESYDYGKIVMDEEKVRNNLGNVFDVFDNIDIVLNEVPVNKDKLAYFSNYQAYRQWTELMKIAFLATCGIPKYDINMNNALRVVLQQSIVERKELASLMQGAEDLLSLQSLKKAEEI